jgi:hypothetical protein
MVKETIDEFFMPMSFPCQPYYILYTRDKNEFMTLWPVLLQRRLQILLSSYTSTSQMLLFLRGSLARHRHQGKSMRPDGRPTPRTSRACAREHDRVGATVPRQGSVRAQAPGRPPVAALWHTQNCAGPACSLNVSAP